MEPEKPCARAGRPRGFCADAALDRATDVFWRKGYDGTSLSDLTAAMGINRPSLYAAYGNKEQLFRRAMARYGEQAAGLMRQAEAMPTARAFVERLLLGVVERATRPGRPKGCFLLQAAGGCCDGDALRREVARMRADTYALIERRLARAAPAELPAGTDAATLSRYLVVVLNGLSTQAAAGADADALRGVVGTALRVWPTEAA